MSTLKVNTISHNTPGQTITVSDQLAVTANSTFDKSLVIKENVIGNDVKVGNTTSSVSISAYNFKNKIINGDMIIAQRGETWTSAPNNTWGVDRWLYTKASTTGVATVSRADITGYPITNNSQLTKSLKVLVTTADGTVAADSYHALRQPIEGNFARDLISRTFTVSFWVRSSKTGLFSASITNPGDSANLRSYIYDYTISSANTWEYKSFTVEGGLPSSGTWDIGNEHSLNLIFILVSGSDYKTATVGSWIAAHDYASTAMTNNLFDTNGATFEITGIQLELGSTATDFEILPPSTILNLCDRYCQRIGLTASIYYTTTGIFSWRVPYRALMRTTPTYTEVARSLNTGVSDITFTPENGFGTVNIYVTSSGTAGGGNSVGNLEAEML